MKLGAEKLANYLGDNNIRPSHFAETIGKYPSTVARIIDGYNIPDIETATLIEKHTSGAVVLADWAVESKKKPKTK